MKKILIVLVLIGIIFCMDKKDEEITIETHSPSSQETLETPTPKETKEDKNPGTELKSGLKQLKRDYIDNFLFPTFNNFFEYDFPSIFRPSHKLMKKLRKRNRLSDLWNGFEITTKPEYLTETEKTFEIELIVPGIKKEEISIEVLGDKLLISIKNKEIQEEYKLDINRANMKGISANLDLGILKVSIPKKAENVEKPIKININ